jgi:hypothetical protein
MSKLNIPNALRQVAGKKVVFLKGATVQSLMDALRKNAAIAGPGMEEHESFSGTVFSVTPQAEAVVSSLCLTKDKPKYVPAPASPPASGATRLYVPMGTVNEKLVSGWTDHYDLSADTWFWVKVLFSANSDRLEVASAAIVHGASATAETSGDWGAKGEFPPHFVVPIGYFGATSKAIQNYGSGSISIAANISSVVPVGSFSTDFYRQISYCRLG